MIKVLGKADEILAAVAENDGITFSALARKTGMAKSTLSQILKTMTELGWIARGEKGGFSPGDSLIGYTRKKLRAQSLESVLSEAVRQLAGAAGQTASTSIITGNRRVRAAKTYGSGEITVDDEKTPRGPGGFLSTATGRVLAAFQDPRRRSVLIEEDGLSATPGLLKELDEVKRQGFAVHESGGGAASIACGIFSASGDIAAAIGVAVPAYDLTPDKKKFYAERVKEAAGFAEQMLNT